MLRTVFATPLAELEERIHVLYGLNAAAFDAAGARVTTYVNWANPLCQRIKADPASGQAICAVANGHFLRLAETTGQPASGECDAGFCKFCVPIIVNGRFLGVVGGCGRLPSEGALDAFAVGKATDLPERAILALLGECPSISQELLAEAVAYVQAETKRMVSDAR